MKIVIATENPGKIKEFKLLFSRLNFEVISKIEAGVTEKIKETGKSFKENAILKATAVFEKTKLPTIADDSGLEVFSLNNRPGIFSARYSEEENIKATDERNNLKLLKEMESKIDRAARFVCALCFINSSGKIYNILETVEGTIATTLKGSNGFGYDRLFLYNNEYFSMIPTHIKNKVSHRGKATAKLLKNIKNWI